MGVGFLLSSADWSELKQKSFAESNFFEDDWRTERYPEHPSHGGIIFIAGVTPWIRGL